MSIGALRQAVVSTDQQNSDAIILTGVTCGAMSPRRNDLARAEVLAIPGDISRSGYAVLREEQQVAPPPHIIEEQRDWPCS